MAHPDLATLSPYEQCIAALARIPRLNTKIQCMQIQSYYSESICSARAGIAAVQGAAVAIQGSVRLRLVLETALRVGNTMNSGTLKGGARAVRLDTLQRLEDMRISKLPQKKGDKDGGGGAALKPIAADPAHPASRIGSLLDYVAYIVARVDNGRGQPQASLDDG